MRLIIHTYYVVLYLSPTPSSFFLPYLTLSYLTLPYLTLPYLTLPYLTLRYLTLSYLTLPYLTLPYLTSPHTRRLLHCSPMCYLLFDSHIFNLCYNFFSCRSSYSIVHLCVISYSIPIFSIFATISLAAVPHIQFPSFFSCSL